MTFSYHAASPDHPVEFIPKYDGDTEYLTEQDALRLIKGRSPAAAAEFERLGKTETYDGYWTRRNPS